MPVTLETGDLVNYRDLTMMSSGQRDVGKPVNILKDLDSKMLEADSYLEEAASGKLTCDYDILRLVVGGDRVFFLFFCCRVSSLEFSLRMK